MPVSETFKKWLRRGLSAGDKITLPLFGIGRFQPLRGHFSAQELLKSGDIEGAVIAESQPVGLCPEYSMTRLCGMNQHDHQPWPVLWTLSHDARLVGELMSWRNNNNRQCIEGSYYHEGRLAVGKTRFDLSPLISATTELEGAWTSIISCWSRGENYYHWMIDSLGRLMVRDFLPEPTRIIIPHSERPFVAETIEMLGLSSQCEAFAKTSLKPERFYFCSPPAMTGVHNPMVFDWLRSKFSPFFAPPLSGDPIFFTRRGAARIPDGLPELEQRFERAGFKIVDCGVISVSDQISLASGAPAIAGLHGAAMTNLLWARRHVPVLEIFQPSFLNACYEQIAFHRALDYSFHILHGQEFKMVQDWLEVAKKSFPSIH